MGSYVWGGDQVDPPSRVPDLPVAYCWHSHGESAKVEIIAALALGQAEC